MHEQRLATLDQRIEEVTAELAHLESGWEATAAVLDAEIAEAQRLISATDEAVRNGFQGKAGEVAKAQRREACRRQAAALKVKEEGRATISRIRNERESLLQARREAAFEGGTLADCKADELAARAKLAAVRDERTKAESALESSRKRLSDAQAAEGHAAAAAADLATLRAARESLLVEAFIAGKAADPAKLADLDDRISDAELAHDRAQSDAAGACAAMAQLERVIAAQRETVAGIDERIRRAEQGVRDAVAATARWQIAECVEQVRAHLITLEAANKDDGRRLREAMDYEGLRTFNVDGRLVRPRWLHSGARQNEAYAREVATRAAELVTGH